MMLKKYIIYTLLLFLFSTHLKSQNSKPVISSGSNPTHILISVAQEYIMRSINGGVSWSTVYQGVHGEQFYTLSFIDSDVGFAMGSADESKIGCVVKTIDGGLNWVDQADSLPNIVANKNIDSSTDELSTTIYAGGSSGLILRYDASSGKWSDVSRGGVAWIDGIYAFNDSVSIGSGSGEYNMSKTVDSGENWTSTYTEPDELFTDLSFNGNTGYAITSQEETPNKRLFKSTDNGSTWTVVETSIFSDYMMLDIINVDSDNWLISGTTVYVDDAKLWKSTNGGIDWIDISDKLPDDVYGLRDIAFEDINNIWISTEGGRVIYTNDSGKTWKIYYTPIEHFNYGLHDVFLLR